MKEKNITVDFKINVAKNGKIGVNALKRVANYLNECGYLKTANNFCIQDNTYNIFYMSCAGSSGDWYLECEYVDEYYNENTDRFIEVDYYNSIAFNKSKGKLINIEYDSYKVD